MMGHEAARVTSVALLLLACVASAAAASSGLRAGAKLAPGSIPTSYQANITIHVPSRPGPASGRLLASAELQRMLLVVEHEEVPVLWLLQCPDLQATYNWTARGGDCKGTWGSPDSVDLFFFVGQADASQGGACVGPGGRAGTRWGLEGAYDACVASNGDPLWFAFVTVGVGYNFTAIDRTPPPPAALALPDDCARLPGLPAHGQPPMGLFDDFEAGLAPFWVPSGAEHGMYVAGHITTQSAHVRHGRFAANVTVRAGDIRDGDSERDELNARPWPLMGQTSYYGWSQLLPADFPIVDDRLVMGQLKQGGLGDVSPMWAQRFINGRWYFTVLTVNDSKQSHVFDTNATYPLGVWNDMVVGVHYSRGADGWLQVWHNGTRLVHYEGPTAHADEGDEALYFKWGLYRDNWATPWTAYFDTFTVGRTFADVDPARFD